MIHSEALKSKIIDMIQTLPVYNTTSNRRNWVVRCPYCGDSKNPKHAHLSIKIDLTSDDVMLYRCFKCNESGILTPQTLEDIGIPMSLRDIKTFESFNRSYSRNTNYGIDKPKNYCVGIESPSSIADNKLLYISNRIGKEFNYSNCVKYKIILTLSEFLKRNNIRITNSQDTKIPNALYIPIGTLRELDLNYVGFLSSNNNKITFRDISQNSVGYFGRYYKLTLDAYNQSPNTFYGLNNSFDLLYTNDMNIHIAEGTFDILSVKENLHPQNSENALFFASCGYGFSTILKYLIYKGVTSDINLHIYSDADKSDLDHYKALHKKNIDLWLDHVIIHRNRFEGEKDFGVPLSRISEYNYRLDMKGM